MVSFKEYKTLTTLPKHLMVSYIPSTEKNIAGKDTNCDKFRSY